MPVRTAPRVRPNAALGWIVGVGYAALFFALELVGHVPYTKLADNADNVLHAVVIPLAVGTLVLAAVTTYFGWWAPAIREDRPRRPWMLAVPVLMFVAVASDIDYPQLGRLGATYLVYLTVGGVLVGFAEEIAYRGLTLTAMRGSYPEWGSALLVSALFGLLHGVNFFLGQSLGRTIYQIFFAFALGLVFYVARRASGTLIVPMAIHGLWDFGVFTYAGGAAITGVNMATFPLRIVALPSAIAALAVSLAALPYLFRNPTSAEK